MADGQDNKSLDVTEHEFNKSDDTQTTADSGVGDGVDFAESLPGGGEDNDRKSGVATSDNAGIGEDKDQEFDHRADDDEKS